MMTRRSMASTGWSSVRPVSVAAAMVFASVTGVAAQTSSCADVQKIMSERKSISNRISAASKGKQIEAKTACTGFGQLVANGQTLVKWIETNKDWCQIPDGFAESIKTDHGRAVQIRGKACSVAAKQVQMEKQAKAAGPAPSGLLGGNGLTGQSKLPQGAL